MDRYDCEALEDSEETAESIEGFRGAVGRVSGLLGRDGGGIVPGDEGGEMLAEERTGAETFRSWAYEDGFPGMLPPLVVWFGGVGEKAWVGVVCWERSKAIKASSFSRGERGPSW